VHAGFAGRPPGLPLGVLTSGRCLFCVPHGSRRDTGRPASVPVGASEAGRRSPVARIVCYEKTNALTSRNPTGQCGATRAAERTNASSTQPMPRETKSERECVRRKGSEDTAIRPSRYRVRHNVMPRCGAGSNCLSGSQAPLTIPTSTHSLWGQYAPPPFSSQVVLLVKHAPTALKMTG
jgi:hypothetical protein